MTDAATPAPSAAPSVQAISRDVLVEKYAKGDERTADDVRRRVARALAATERPEERALGNSASSRPSDKVSSQAAASTPQPAPGSSHAHQLLRAAGGRFDPA